ncbi:hypothetical protein EAG_04048 [Camponotus floridanus]|uniref:WW domain-containing protein n=2 Tax=Camponotus floridanus TaxID=104421 RepID=E2B1W4_CAMFO|nr:hypothetical protein EAG_04048 [Camponotus floridanus]
MSDTSEFDGEDEDVASWSSKRTNDDDRDGSSASRAVREFGDLVVDNYGWIQCRSKSYPDQVYFHNTHSNCNTWYRPISRYIDIPFISVKKVYHTSDVSGNNIELLSVSDNENEPDVSAAKRDGDESSTAVPDVIARCYYTPQVDLTSDVDDSCRSSVDASANECHCEKEQIDENNNENDEDIANEKSDPETVLCATNFLETDFFVGENQVNTERIDRIFNTSKEDADDDVSLSEAPCLYDVPRLKRISLEDQLIKPRRTRVSNRVSNRVKRPRKIICEMYGTRTINYDLPTPDQVPAEVGVKLSTLSESDSDVNEPSPQDAKTTLSFESQWCDIEKNLHQPLLSDPSSSPSSRSDTNSTSSTISSCSTCSSST